MRIRRWLAKEYGSSISEKPKYLKSYFRIVPEGTSIFCHVLLCNTLLGKGIWIIGLTTYTILLISNQSKFYNWCSCAGLHLAIKFFISKGTSLIFRIYNRSASLLYNLFFLSFAFFRFSFLIFKLKNLLLLMIIDTLGFDWLEFVYLYSILISHLVFF